MAGQRETDDKAYLKAQRMDRPQAGFGMDNVLRNLGINLKKDQEQPKWDSSMLTPRVPAQEGSEENKFFKWLKSLFDGKSEKDVLLEEWYEENKGKW